MKIIAVSLGGLNVINILMEISTEQQELIHRSGCHRGLHRVGDLGIERNWQSDEWLGVPCSDCAILHI